MKGFSGLSRPKEGRGGDSRRLHGDPGREGFGLPVAHLSERDRCWIIRGKAGVTDAFGVADEEGFKWHRG
jgi:hypothetical protein